jgi:hypothetical protein
LKNHQPHPYPGRGLSWREWKKTLQALPQYLTESEAGIDGEDTWVDKIDRSFINRDTRAMGEDQNCRYLANERQKDVLREFIRAAQKIYVDKWQA